MNVLPPSICFHLLQRFKFSNFSKIFAWNTEAGACHRHGITCTAEKVYKERLLSRGAGVKQAGYCCVLLVTWRACRVAQLVTQSRSLSSR